jgi:hypothetical protein
MNILVRLVKNTTGILLLEWSSKYKNRAARNPLVVLRVFFGKNTVITITKTQALIAVYEDTGKPPTSSSSLISGA